MDERGKATMSDDRRKVGIGVSVTGRLKRLLDAMAAKTGKTRSTVAAELIEKQLDEGGQQGESATD